MVENPYDGSTGPLDNRRRYAARHEDAWRFAAYSLLLGVNPEKEYEELYDQGLLEIKKNPTKALKLVHRIKLLYGIYNTLTTSTIIEPTKSYE